MDSAGNLYGENSSGVFELTQSGGIWTEKLILPAAIFTDGGSGSGLTTVGGNIYGIGSGKVFELSPRSGGGWKAKVIHEFAISGTNAEGTLIADAAGNLYGTTAGGGLGFGTVYKLTLETTGKWKLTVLYAFKNNGTDGENPWGGVVLDSAGNLYGTTQNGGTSGYGTVFELSPPQAGKTAYTEKVLCRSSTWPMVKRPIAAGPGQRRQPLWQYSAGRIVWIRHGVRSSSVGCR